MKVPIKVVDIQISKDQRPTKTRLVNVTHFSTEKLKISSQRSENRYQVWLFFLTEINIVFTKMTENKNWVKKGTVKKDNDYRECRCLF